jgi:hypothetical protein
LKPATYLMLSTSSLTDHCRSSHHLKPPWSRPVRPWPTGANDWSIVLRPTYQPTRLIVQKIPPTGSITSTIPEGKPPSPPPMHKLAVGLERHSKRPGSYHLLTTFYPRFISRFFASIASQVPKIPDDKPTEAENNRKVTTIHHKPPTFILCTAKWSTHIG